MSEGQDKEINMSPENKIIIPGGFGKRYKRDEPEVLRPNLESSGTPENESTPESEFGEIYVRAQAYIDNNIDFDEIATLDGLSTEKALQQLRIQNKQFNEDVSALIGMVMKADSEHKFDLLKAQFPELMDDTEWENVESNIEILKGNVLSNSTGNVPEREMLDVVIEGLKAETRLGGIKQARERGLVGNDEAQWLNDKEYTSETIKDLKIASLRALGLSNRVIKAPQLYVKPLPPLMPQDHSQENETAEAIRRQNELLQRQIQIEEEKLRNPQQPVRVEVQGAQAVDDAERNRRDANREFKDRVRAMYYGQPFISQYPETKIGNPDTLYGEVADKEKDIFEAAWHLARAAEIVKDSKAEFFGKPRENSNYNPFSDMRVNYDYGNLYRMKFEGGGYRMTEVEDGEKSPVALMLEAYAKKIVNNEMINLGNGYESTLLSCTRDFEKARSKIREEVLSNLNLTQEQEMFIDSVAWNMIRIGALPEAASSRYSYSGESNYPVNNAQVINFSIRGAIHPQESWEVLCGSDALSASGPFDVWGKEQVSRIKKEVGDTGRRTDGVRYTYKYFPAKNRGEFFRHSATRNIDAEGVTNIVVMIRVPEVVAHTTALSFWEATKVKIDGDEKTLLEALVDGDNIPWHSVKSDELITWTAKIRNGSSFASMFNDSGNKIHEPMKRRDDGWAGEWTKAVMSVWNASQVNSVLEPTRLLERKRRDEIVTYLDEHKLKVWLVEAAGGGPRDKTSRQYVSGIKEGLLVASILRKKDIGYLKGGTFSRERLVVE